MACLMGDMNLTGSDLSASLISVLILVPRDIRQ